MLIRVIVVCGIVVGLGVLFLKTVRDAESAPYTIRQAHLETWTVTIADRDDPIGALLTLRPPPELPMSVSQQIFRRHTETLMAPAVRSVPVVLRSEFEQAFAGKVSSEELATLADEEALAASHFTPICVAARSRPGGRTFFVLFEAEAFERVRQLMRTLLETRGGDPAAFDPHALSPVLLIASSDRNYTAWLPRRGEPETDCVSPVTLE